MSFSPYMHQIAAPAGGGYIPEPMPRSPGLAGPFAGVPDILGYGTRPSGFAGLAQALARLGFPGGAGLGYPMAALGPLATMGPQFAPMQPMQPMMPYPGAMSEQAAADPMALLSQMIMAQQSAGSPIPAGQ